MQPCAAFKSLWGSFGSEWIHKGLDAHSWKTRLMNRKIKRRGCDYGHSGGGEGDGEREVLTLSKLANRSASRML